jgi:serine/threonine-protein kinase
MSTIKIGALVDGRYRIEARIGHGGMAEVYEATDIINKRKVAIKMIREDVMKNPINLRRFQNEATIASSLNHPNIVKVFNHGTIEGRPYIANEYVRGQSMKDMLDFRTSIPIAEAVSYMLQLTSALFYAHQHNIIHRDIKPQNIYVMPDGTIKLGDFGIAQAGGVDDSFTKTSEIVGSVHYLAPEISQGKPASIQSDIYAAGVTFYELLTGHVPFDKDTPVNVAVAHVKEKFPPVKKYVPNCPKEIEKIIANATRKRLSDRYKGADEFYDDLLEISKHPELLKEKKPLISRIFGFK